MFSKSSGKMREKHQSLDFQFQHMGKLGHLTWPFTWVYSQGETPRAQWEVSAYFVSADLRITGVKIMWMAMFPGRKRAKSEAQRISWLFDFLTRSGYFLKGKQSRSYQKSYTSFTILLCNVVNINWANKNKYSLLLLLLSHYVVSNSASPWTTAHQAPLPLSPRVCSNSFPLSHWCYLTISSSATPFSFCLQSFPASGSFPMSRLFPSGSQSTEASASASVLPMHIQGWFSLGRTGLISLQFLESPNSERQKAEWWLPGAGSGRNESLFSGDRVSAWENGSFLWLNGGDGCTTLWMYLAH